MPAVRAIHPSTPNSGRILRIDQCRSSPFALIEIQDHSGRTIPAEPDPVTDHHLARLATENRTVAVRHAGVDCYQFPISAITSAMSTSES